jgi:hypothetical protein
MNGWPSRRCLSSSSIQGRIATTNLRYASTLDWVLSVGLCVVDAGVDAESLPIACCKLAQLR